jgi:hypothetical protein
MDPKSNFRTSRPTRMKPLKSSSKNGHLVVTPTLTLTGNRRENRFEIYLLGRPLELTCSTFKALVDLVIARGAPGNGYVRAERISIHRLREAMDIAVALGTGKSLIETGSGEEYRLTIPRDELSSQIVLTPCFVELDNLNILTTQQVTRLRGLCGATQM